jgi:hypothetical protein
MSGLFDADDADDPWTFFGQFSKTEIEGASRILAEASIVFEVKEADGIKRADGLARIVCGFEMKVSTLLNHC